MTFILLGVTYFVIVLVIIIVVLTFINKKEKNKYQGKINELERDKNLIISTGILTELNKVEGLINNDSLREKFDGWKQRFQEIKEKDIPKISDDLIELEELYANKNMNELKDKLAKVEYEIYYVKTKSNYLLEEIRDITLSDDRNRDSVTKLKVKYRECVAKYNNNKNEYDVIMAPVELQFENVDKLFSAFEVAIDNNNYEEVSKIVKALDDLIGNLIMVIDEAPDIILMGNKLLPLKMKDVEENALKMIGEGYNLDYLNIDYNIKESRKKVTNVLERLNVLNIEDSTLELKTILDYFDGIYESFDKEKESRKVFEEYMSSVIARCVRYERINNDLNKRIDEFKYSYDLTDDDVKVIGVIAKDLKDIRVDYDRVIEAYRSKSFAYSRLAKEMDILNKKLLIVKEKLDESLKSIGSLKEDEVRAREQLLEIKDILRRSKHKINSYKLPMIPKSYYVELAEATDAIDEMVKELNKHPISIKVLNIRVDTARDLVLKLYNTSNELVKAAYLAETAVVYGNRFRVLDSDVDNRLNISQNLFFHGEFKKSLESSINAIQKIEPNFYETLMQIMKGND